MTVNENGSNALHIAVKKEYVETVTSLIDLKFPVDIPKKNGVTALGIAAFSGNLIILRALHKAGARLDVTSGKGGLTPLILSIKSHKFDCLRYIVDNSLGDFL